MAEAAPARSFGINRTGARIGHLLDSERVFGYVLVAPAVAYIVLLVGYPFAIALWFTVSNSTVAHPISDFTGLRNLQGVLDDDIFRTKLARGGMEAARRMSWDHMADVQEGEEVQAQQTLIILTAMKMEHAVQAPFAATVGRIHVKLNTLAIAGSPLIELSPA